MKKDVSGFWAILVSAVIYGAYGCLARFLNVSFGDFTQVAFRGGVAVLITIIVILASRKGITLRRRELLKSLLLGLVFFGGVTLFTFASIHEKISVVLFVFYAGSFTASILISRLYYKEKLNPQKWIALTIVLAGLVTTTGLNFEGLGWGLLAALISGVLDSICSYFRKELSDQPKEQVMAVQFVVTLLLALAGLFFTQEQAFKNVNPAAIVTGIVWGGFWALSNRLLMVGFKRFDFMLGQIVLSSEIFFATVLAFIFFAEAPGGYELIGGCMIFLGVCLINLDLQRFDLFGWRERLRLKK